MVERAVGSRSDGIARVVASVVRSAVREAGSRGVAILDDGSPEARLAVSWCRQALGEELVWPVAPPAGSGPLLRLARDVHAAAASEEAHRMLLRLRAAAERALQAHPANKTALLLGRVPPEPLLPLGDLYASDVEGLTGSWNAPARVRELAAAAGGIAALDRALRSWLEERRPLPESVAHLPTHVGSEVRSVLVGSRFWRRRAGLVPKLGARTLGMDLFS